MKIRVMILVLWLVMAFGLMKSSKGNDFRKLSTGIKIFMVVGIGLGINLFF